MSDRYRLGIDLSTRNIGFCILNELNEVLHKSTLELSPFSFDNSKMKSNISKIRNHLMSILDPDTLKYCNMYEWNRLWVGIELSNYGNNMLTNHFHFYAGIIWDLLTHRTNEKYSFCFHDVVVKCFNANQWMYKCGIRPKDERDRRKKAVRKFVMEHSKEYDPTWTEDECDAYCIAYWLDELQNTDELHANVQKKKRDANKRTWLLYSLERKLTSKLAELASLDKVRNAKRIETVKVIIEGLRKEISDVKKKTHRSKN